MEIVRRRAEELGVVLEDVLDTKEFAALMDEKDELRAFRRKFLFPKKKVVMEDVKQVCEGSSEEIERKAAEDSVDLCGNSLGLQPASTRDRVMLELDDWHRFGVEGHFKSTFPWLTADEFVIRQVCRLLSLS